MWSFFSKKKDKSPAEEASLPNANSQLPLPRTTLSTPEDHEAKESKESADDEVIDLATDPRFIAIANAYEADIKYHSEVPIRMILNHLKEFDDSEKTKIANTILKELAGLAKELPQYKNNHLTLSAVSDYIKQFASPSIAKYVNTIYAHSIKPSNAKILPSLFEDFENAFLGSSDEEIKKKSETKIKIKILLGQTKCDLYHTAFLRPSC